jgi:hypothetical protein
MIITFFKVKLEKKNISDHFNQMITSIYLFFIQISFLLFQTIFPKKKRKDREQKDTSLEKTISNNKPLND